MKKIAILILAFGLVASFCSTSDAGHCRCGGAAVKAKRAVGWFAGAIKKVAKRAARPFRR